MKLMKTKLVEFIKKIVRREAKKIVKEMVEEQVQMQLQEIMMGEQVAPKRVTKEKVYTKNATLNEILNETVNDPNYTPIPAEGAPAEIPTLGGKTFTSADAQGMGHRFQNMMQPQQQGGGLGTDAELMARRQGTTLEALPEKTKDALTKDYSGFMDKVKEADAKRKGK